VIIHAEKIMPATAWWKTLGSQPGNTKRLMEKL